MRFAKPFMIGAAALGLACASLAEVTGPLPLAWRWVESTSVAPSGSPLVQGDRVYVAVGGRVYCLDKATGNQVWRFPVGAPLESSFRLGLKPFGANLLAASDDNSVFALNGATGEIIWQHQSADAISGPPVAIDSGVAIPLSGSKLMALSRADGLPLYTAPLAIVGGLNPRITPYQNTVILTARSGEMAAYDLATQNKIWKRSFTRLDPLTEPTINGDQLLINTSGFVVSLSASSGAVRWRTSVGRDLLFSPGADGDSIVAVSRFGELYSLNRQGRKVFEKGIPLGAGPIASPKIVGGAAIVPLSNGSIVLIDVKTGDVIWNYSIPAFKRNESSTGAAPGAGGLGGPGGDDAGDFGGPGGGFGAGPAGGLGGPGGPQGQRSSASESPFVPAAGPAVVSGDAMLVLVRDGSLISFDSQNGVDLTPPVSSVLFPSQGAIIAGKIPMEMVFRIEDIGCGVNPDTVQLTVNGEPVKVETSREGIVRFRIVARGVNKPLKDGRTEFVLSASDWLGNSSSRTYTFLVDNTLPPLGGPQQSASQQGRQGGQGGGFGGGAAAGGDKGGGL